MEWTTERRYRRYEDWSNDEIKQIKEKMAQSPWHTHYHVEPKMGLLNDPNGFSYFDGKWILFYQNFPFGAAHGLKSWVQLESDDLVHFTETGVKILPDTPLDSHGAYSGSAMQFGDQLFLFYTGNVRDDNWVRHPYQIGALMDKDGNIKKIDNIAASRKYPPTPPQWQAIAITGADILVAAAAGSGKTEVLSERIARKVATKRWDIDRLLVLTFTTAAAKNMIVRIEDKISERLLSTNKEEDLLFLRKQRMLMNDAYVSTIDSFCLNVLKKFYYLVEEKIDNQIKYLSPNFGILANSKGLLSETIGNVLEELVKDDSSSTDLLFTVFGSKQNITSFIIDIYYKLLNIPNFQKYLEESNYLKLLSYHLNTLKRTL